MLKKLYKTPKYIVKSFLLGKKVPFFVNMSLTYRCNFSCKYCNIPNIKEKEMKTKQIFSLVDELSGLGTFRIGLTGGEPTLRKDLGKIIGYIKNKGILTSLCSNGYLVKRYLNRLKGLDILVISLETNEDVQGRQRKKYSFGRIYEACLSARDSGIETWIFVTLTKNSITSLKNVIRKVNEDGLKLELQPVSHYSFSSPRVGKLMPQKSHMQEAMRFLIKEKKKGSNIVNSLSYLRYLYLNWPSQNQRLKCHAGKLFCSISPSGYVYPCFFLQNNANALNCAELGFKKAFDSMPKFSCNGCFCDTYLETNLFLFPSPGSFLKFSKLLLTTG
jgi:MoaA/NifB/PqqE/SkfB family radical SAM enzyme